MPGIRAPAISQAGMRSFNVKDTQMKAPIACLDGLRWTEGTCAGGRARARPGTMPRFTCPNVKA